jgi:hypothetical protein
MTALIRAGYKTADIQQAVMGLLKSKTASGGSPWTSWTAIEGWPGKQVFENFTKPFLYCQPPGMYSREYHQGGGKAQNTWELVIGGWADRQNGGSEEAAIMLSSLINLFQDDSVNSIKFSGTIGGTAFTSKTLPELGVEVLDIQNPREITIEETDDFRGELSIILRA